MLAPPAQPPFLVRLHHLDLAVDPKMPEAGSRYLFTLFGYGSNLGAAQTARHAPEGITPRILRRINAQHITTHGLEAARNDVIMLHNVFDLTQVLTEMSEEGYIVTPARAQRLSPHMTEHIKRFGQYVLDMEEKPEPLQLQKLPFS
ncbi:MAG: Tn3 family transposase [Gemmatimonadetes bacterium]|nr:Tn3 family transposase [Gemmatimonadota bacterium]